MAGQQLNIHARECDHTAMLGHILQTWTDREADMYLVTEDGCKIYTQRILISFYSSMLDDILKSASTNMVGVSVPSSSVSIVKLLKVLTTGTVVATAEKDLMEVAIAAKCLGVGLTNIMIDGKVKRVGNQSKMNAVEVLLKKVPYKNDNIEDVGEILIEGSAEVDNPEDLDCLEVSFSDIVTSAVPPVPAVKNKKFKSSSISQSCEKCGKRFASKTGLDKHMNMVHENDKPRPHICDICDKRFSSVGGLSTHNLIHTAGKSYKCADCDYAAVQKGNLKIHRQRHHKNILRKEDNESPV